MKLENRMQCPKCKAYSGDDWSQCGEKCPMLGSPHYDEYEHSRHNMTYMEGEYTKLIDFEPKETWPEIVEYTTIDDPMIHKYRIR